MVPRPPALSRQAAKVAECWLVQDSVSPGVMRALCVEELIHCCCSKGWDAVEGFPCNPDLHSQSLKPAPLSKPAIVLCSVNVCAKAIPSMVFLLLCIAFWELEEGMEGKRGAEEAGMSCSRVIIGSGRCLWLVVQMFHSKHAERWGACEELFKEKLAWLLVVTGMMLLSLTLMPPLAVLAIKYP